MTRDQFIAAFLAALNGELFEALRQKDRSGAEAYQWLMLAGGRMQARLGAMYDALRPPEPKPLNVPPANGQNPQQVKKNA